MLLMALALSSVVAPAAQAATPSLDIDACTGGSFENWDFTSKVVGCLRDTITEVVLEPDGFLDTLSDYMTATVSIMVAFAIAVFGMRVLGGENNLMPRAIGFMLRLGLVMMFSVNLGGIGQAIFDSMDEMICMVNLDAAAVAPASEQAEAPGIYPQSGTTIETFSRIEYPRYPPSRPPVIASHGTLSIFL